MQILATDYDNYAAVYYCFDILGLFKFEYAWLLVRSRTPSEEVVSTSLLALSNLALTKYQMLRKQW